MSKEEEVIVEEINEEEKEKYSGALMKGLEDEIEALEKERAGGTEEETSQEEVGEEEEQELTAEEETWKKRYGDQRRHTQKKEIELKARVEELANQLTALREEKIDVQLPNTEEELTKFMEDYPDIYNVMQSISMKRNKESNKEFEDKFAALEKKQKEVELKDARAELKDKHPDLDRINASPIFAEWVKEAPEEFKTILFVKADPNASGRILDLFKKETGWKSLSAGTKDKGQQKETEASAAQQVKGPKTSEPKEGTKRVFRESEIAAMKIHEYEKLESEISAANRDGRIILDLTRPDLR